jgi:hypothetical protein
MQPTYLPWLGYFDLIKSADIFVIYDHVQFEKQLWQQRNRIRNRQGEIRLTVSVQHVNGLKRSIKDVIIDTSRNVLGKHLSSIRMAYSKAVSFDAVFPDLERVYGKAHKYLIDLNLDLLRVGLKHFNMDKDFIFSSTMNVQGKKVEALLDICQKLGADCYLSPVGSKVYIEENNLFLHNNIKLKYQNFLHPVYQQLSYPDFISHLAFIDFLLNVDISEVSRFGSPKFDNTHEEGHSN